MIYIYNYFISYLNTIKHYTIIESINMFEKFELPEFSFKLKENRTKIKKMKNTDIRTSMLVDELKVKNARFALISTDRIEDSNVFTNAKQFMLAFVRALKSYTKDNEMENSALYGIMKVKKDIYLLMFNFNEVKFDIQKVENRFVVKKK